jgi:hypothetical protein
VVRLVERERLVRDRNPQAHVKPPGVSPYLDQLRQAAQLRGRQLARARAPGVLVEPIARARVGK